MEKRRDPRIATWTKIQFSQLWDESLGEGDLKNLSKGGVFVTLIRGVDTRDLKPPHELKFRFDLPTGPVNGIAQIAWIKPETSEMGLRFQRIDNSDGLSNLLSFLQNAETPGT
ncbi:MAG TPA: PilZ domain-containing protein [bacterium]|nr:PilZ domain-containing protein [bacterium]